MGGEEKTPREGFQTRSKRVRNIHGYLLEQDGVILSKSFELHVVLTKLCPLQLHLRDRAQKTRRSLDESDTGRRKEVQDVQDKNRAKYKKNSLLIKKKKERKKRKEKEIREEDRKKRVKGLRKE